MVKLAYMATYSIPLCNSVPPNKTSRYCIRLSSYSFGLNTFKTCKIFWTNISNYARGSDAKKSALSFAYNRYFYASVWFGTSHRSSSLFAELVKTSQANISYGAIFLLRLLDLYDVCCQLFIRSLSPGYISVKMCDSIEIGNLIYSLQRHQ